MLHKVPWRSAATEWVEGQMTINTTSLYVPGTCQSYLKRVWNNDHITVYPCVRELSTSLSLWVTNPLSLMLGQSLPPGPWSVFGDIYLKFVIQHGTLATFHIEADYAHIRRPVVPHCQKCRRDLPVFQIWGCAHRCDDDGKEIPSEGKQTQGWYRWHLWVEQIIVCLKSFFWLCVNNTAKVTFTSYPLSIMWNLSSPDLRLSIWNRCHGRVTGSHFY